MTIQRVYVDNDQVRVDLCGSIYVDDAAEVLEKLNGFINRGHTTFLIDLSAVDYIDSAGIGTLIAIHKRSRKCDGGVAVKGLNGLVKELFTLTRVDKVFDVVQ